MGRINRHVRAGLAVAVLLAAPFGAHAQGTLIDIPAQDLAAALSQLARTANIELLFDQSQVSGKRARALRTTAAPAQALTQLLTGSGLSYRRIASGAFIIMPLAPTGRQASDDAATRPPAPIPEILVVGRRTQNTDIRRNPDDIQPYQVTDSAEIDQAQSATPEDFLKTRLPVDAQQATLAQSPAGNLASTRSQIDLRGLGPDQTLVLIDGRRLPSVPDANGFSQADLNGLSQSDIDRIETLGASAGGLFGIGAAGGVVNVVLKRQYDGGTLSVTNGITDHGDGWRRGADGGFGFTSPDGGTRVMVSAGFSQDDGLDFGDRDFVVAARALEAERQPTLRQSVASSSINFNSIDGSDLTLIPSLGGGSLGASTTFLPVNSPAVAAGGLAILKANAGRYDISLSPDAQGTKESLVTPTRTDSFTGAVRQKIGDRVEAYVEFLWLDDDGRAIVPAIDTATNILFGGNPGNPFNQLVAVSFPTPGLEGVEQNLTHTDRLSAGLIARLGDDWAANLDVATGEASVRVAVDKVADPVTIDATLGPAALAAQLAQYSVSRTAMTEDSDRLNDLNLRIAGPLFRLPGGPATLTATAEWREEDNGGEREQDFGQTGETNSSAGPTRLEVGSVFVEARAPLLAPDSAIKLLRGLELQLAMRADSYSLVAPSLTLVTNAHLPDVTNRGAVTATTLGLRFRPATGITVRASVSDGFTPPTPAQISPFELSELGQIDPKRSGVPDFNLTDAIAVNVAGSPTLRPQHTITLAGGVVFEPPAVPGLRASIDYTRLATTDEITDFAQGDVQYFIDNEAVYPGRVVRGPLTAADKALGYTAGPITAINAGYLQVGRSTLQAVDFALDWSHSFPIGGLHLYLQATWEPSFVRRGDPLEPSFDLVGHADGPLGWRGNGGVDWSQGPWSTGINVQVFGAYSGYLATPITPLQRDFLSSQDSLNEAGTNGYIPAQVFVDWTLAYRSAPRQTGGWARPVEYRFSIKDLFDARPPVVGGTFGTILANNGIAGDHNYSPLGGYSPYGDALGRRFVLTISTTF